jgi:general secretion pathway protein G
MTDEELIYSDPTTGLRKRWIRTWVKVAVVMLLGVVVSFIVVSCRVRSLVNRAAKTPGATRAVMNRLCGVLSMYRAVTGDYPTQTQGLRALVAKPTAPPIPIRWSRQIDVLPVDPWGRPYVYRIPSASPGLAYDLLSLGPDGVRSADDIVSMSRSQAIRTPKVFPVSNDRPENSLKFPTSVTLKPADPGLRP